MGINGSGLFHKDGLLFHLLLLHPGSWARLSNWSAITKPGAGQSRFEITKI